MKVLLVGGGSGGHITPPLAVAHKLKAQDSSTRIEYVIEKGSKFADLPNKSPDIDAVHAVAAGKFRRYHSQSLIAKLLDIPTNLKNIRDLFRFLGGTIQSYFLLRRLKPDAIFIKGGFVGVPVGLAAGWLGIPYITHDSDTVPGLANKIIGKRAAVHAVGMPAEFYVYPKDKIRYVGIPLNKEYKTVSKAKQHEYRKKLGITTDVPVLAITGGSLGAIRLNQAMKPIVTMLLKENKSLQVLHQTGHKTDNLYADLEPGEKERVGEFAFTNELYAYTGAADAVVTRAGATSIAELAVQGKATILVPNPQLTGGHQSKNAEHMAKTGAAVVITEDDLQNATDVARHIEEILNNSHRLQELQRNITKLAKHGADEEIARLITQLVQK